MRQNVLETIIGAVVITVALGFLVFAYTKNNHNDKEPGYIIEAKFQSAEGIIPGSDVMISGIKVGSVEDMVLDNVSFFAVVKMRVAKDIQIPKDSSAAVVSNGLLGGKYISLNPGAEEEVLKEGQAIKFTQSAVNLESLLGKIMFSTQPKNN